MTITTDSISLSSDGSAMSAFVARPQSGRVPALIVLQEAFGVNDHVKDVCRRFAEQGYLAIAPELFHRTAPEGSIVEYGDFSKAAPHLTAVTTEASISDLTAVYEWLLKDQQVDNPHIGAIGFCLGGRVAYLANAKLPIQAAVSFYGGGIAQNLLELAPDQHAPIVFFWGGLDKHILPEHRAAVSEAMSDASKPFINVEISDADHGFFNNDRQAYNANAARQAWALTLSFLSTHLKPK